MEPAGGDPPPMENGWSAQRIDAALPAPLRAQFRREHLSFLAMWQAKAQAAGLPPAGGEAAQPRSSQHKWSDLMDDWEL